MNLNPGKNIRLFQNNLLENLTFVHPLMPISMWAPIIATLFAHSLTEMELSYAIAYSIFGLLFWTFAEYVLHRFVFHYHPTSDFGKRIAYLAHGIHHDDPNDQRRLLMPPVAALIIATVLYGLFSLLLGLVRVNPFFSGFLVGYLCYDYIHYATHWARIKGGWFYRLKKNHMDHHFKAEDKLYGVSSTFWDQVFGTTLPKKK